MFVISIYLPYFDQVNPEYHLNPDSNLFNHYETNPSISEE